MAIALPLTLDEPETELLLELDEEVDDNSDADVEADAVPRQSAAQLLADTTRRVAIDTLPVGGFDEAMRELDGVHKSEFERYNE